MLRRALYRAGLRPHRRSRMYDDGLARRYAWHDTEVTNRAAVRSQRGSVSLVATAPGLGVVPRVACRPRCGVCAGAPLPEV